MSSKESTPEYPSYHSSTHSDYPSAAPSFRGEDYIETYIIVPPDGGWGWVVVFVSFISNFVADGIMYTFGIFLEDISKTYDADVTEVALANSLMGGFYLVSGPFACAILNRFGFQMTGILGGLAAACACGLGTMTNSLTLFLLVYGVFGGCALGLMYVPSIVVVGFYFERYRSLATAIAVTGSAAGIIGFPLIAQNLLAGFTWQVKFQVISGLCAAAAFLAFLYRPLKPSRVLTNRDKKVIQVLSALQKVDSDESQKKGFFKRVFQKFHNTKYPTLTQAHVFHESTIMMYFPTGPSTSSIFINSVPGESATTFAGTPVSNVIYDTKSERLEKLSTLYEHEETHKKNWWRKCCCHYKCCRWCCPLNYQNRPMYRDDIFYGASVYTLSAFPSRMSQSTAAIPTGVEYTMSVTRVEKKGVGHEEKKHGCCPESIVRILATMLNCELLKTISFVFLLVSGFFTILGMYTVFAFLVARADEFKIDREMSVHFFTALGVSNALGRLLSGAVSTIPSANNLMVSYISIIISGASTIASCFFTEPLEQIIYCSIFGLTIASFASLRSPIIVELLGLEKLTNAFGLVLLFHGIGGFLGLPISGQIVQQTGSVNNSFLYAGSAMLLGGLLLIPIRYLYLREMRKEKNGGDSR